MGTKPILIVDDEKNICLTLSKALEVIGAETDSALNGEEALAKLEKKEFGLILLDLRMPGMDGMEVLRRVREIRPDIRVIIISQVSPPNVSVKNLSALYASLFISCFDITSSIIDILNASNTWFSSIPTEKMRIVRSRLCQSTFFRSSME